MAIEKSKILTKLKNGLSCTKLTDAECKVVDNVEFVDVNNVKRACALAPVPFSTSQWCRDRLLI